MRLDKTSDLDRINDLFGEIESTGRENLRKDGFPDDDIVIQRSVDMRYVGQVHECTVAIDNMKIDGDSIGKVIDAFHHRHEELFTYSEPDSPVELVNLESAIYGRVDKPSPPRIEGGVGPDDAVKETRDMVFSADGIDAELTEAVGTPAPQGMIGLECTGKVVADVNPCGFRDGGRTDNVPKRTPSRD